MKFSYLGTLTADYKTKHSSLKLNAPYATNHTPPSINMPVINTLFAGFI